MHHLFSFYYFFSSFFDEVLIGIGWVIFLNKFSYGFIVTKIFAIHYFSCSIHNMTGKISILSSNPIRNSVEL